MVGENTHLSGFGGDVDLDTAWERFVSTGRSRVEDGRPIVRPSEDARLHTRRRT